MRPSAAEAAVTIGALYTSSGSSFLYKKKVKRKNLKCNTYILTILYKAAMKIQILTDHLCLLLTVFLYCSIIRGVMVSVLASSAVDNGFEPRSG